MDYYRILRVPKSATISEIKASFRKLAMTMHPDTCPPVSRLPLSLRHLLSGFAFSHHRSRSALIVWSAFRRFQADRKQAEERFKIILTAYKELLEIKSNGQTGTSHSNHYHAHERHSNWNPARNQTDRPPYTGARTVHPGQFNVEEWYRAHYGPQEPVVIKSKSSWAKPNGPHAEYYERKRQAAAERSATKSQGTAANTSSSCVVS